MIGGDVGRMTAFTFAYSVLKCLIADHILFQSKREKKRIMNNEAWIWYIETKED